LSEEISSEVMQVALLEKTLEHVVRLTEEMKQLREEFSRKSDIHLKYDVDLSVAHTNYEVEDFVKMNFDVDNVNILPLPSAMSIKLRGIGDDPIELGTKELLSLSDHEVTRMLVTNDAGTGTAKIHVFGRFKYPKILPKILRR